MEANCLPVIKINNRAANANANLCTYIYVPSEIIVK